MTPPSQEPSVAENLTVAEADHARPPGRWPGVKGYFLLAFLLACWFVVSTPLPALPGEPLMFRSRSGQFVVRGLSLGTPPVPNVSTSEVSYVRLDPAVLVVSLEHIKQALLTELGMADEWKGTVNVLLHPVRRDNESVRVTSIRYTDKWGYHIDFPERLDRKRFLRASVQVLLMEIANRRAGPRSAEMPSWLAEGMFAHLQATTLAALTLEPQTSLGREGRKRDPLQRPRECLRTNTPLTLDELTMPTPEQLANDKAEVYENCAHLFVSELLHLRNGRACLREMLASLPDYLNWQTAFLRAFQGHFPGLLDVDKWWSLNLVNLTGRDLFSIWPLAQACDRLDEILAVPIQVRVQTNDLPVATEAKLRTVIAEWDLAKQTPLLWQKVNQLTALRRRVGPELIRLVEDYRQVLEKYLQKRSQPVSQPEQENEPAADSRSVVRDTLKRLDELEMERDLLRKTLASTRAKTGR